MRKTFFFALTLLLIANFIFSLAYGYEIFSLKKIVNLLIQKDIENTDYIVLTNIRIPRVVSTYIVGAGLVVVGCVLQSIFLNPLCESYTLGISSAAAIAVVLSTIFSLPFERFYSSIIGPFLGVMTIFLLNRIFKRTIDVGFVLAGVVLNFLFSSVIILLTLFFDPYRLHYILLWLLGGFSVTEPSYVYISSLIIGVCIIIVLLLSPQIDVLVLGRDKSTSLGVKEDRLKNILIILSTVIATFCVSLAGVIAFVGIIIPNIVKGFTGLKHSSWILYSALTGALFISLADNLAKNVIYPIEVPISVFTGILGSIMFIFHLRWKRF